MTLPLTLLGLGVERRINEMIVDVHSLEAGRSPLACAQEALFLSDLLLEGLGRYEYCADQQIVRLVSPGPLHALQELQFRLLVPLRRLLNGDTTPVHCKQYQRCLLLLLSHIEYIWPHLGTRVDHMTLGEWALNQSSAPCPNSGMPPIAGSQALCKILHAHHASVDEACFDWVVRTLQHYSHNLWPIREASLVSITLDLSMIYRSQLEAGSTGWPTPIGEVDDSQLDSDELAGVISGVLNDWDSSGRLRLPMRYRSQRTFAFVKSVLETGGAHTFLMVSGDECRDPCPPSPVALFRGLASHHVSSILSRQPSRLDRETGYLWCDSLEGMVDAATLPWELRPEVLVLDVEDGWLILVGMPAQDWHVHHLSGLKPEGFYTSGALSHLDLRSQTTCRLLGQISEDALSGTLYDRLLEFTDNIPA